MRHFAGAHQRRKPRTNAWMLEEVAQMALATVALNPGVRPIDPAAARQTFPPPNTARTPTTAKKKLRLNLARSAEP